MANCAGRDVSLGYPTSQLDLTKDAVYQLVWVNMDKKTTVVLREPDGKDRLFELETGLNPDYVSKKFLKVFVGTDGVRSLVPLE